MSQILRILLVTVISSLGTGNAMATEEAKYAVMLKEEPFELRAYEAHILAETIVDGDFDDAGSQAFRRLFKYISGDNQSQEKVSMTSPVGQTAANQKIAMTSPVGQKQENGKWVVSFMMPASFTLQTIPQPNDPTVVLRQVPARYMAAVRYSGFWSQKAYLRNKSELQKWIKVKGLRSTGEPTWARYNPPFTPWFLRRNEILFPIEEPVRNDGPAE